jgi:hypothetical protein
MKRWSIAALVAVALVGCGGSEDDAGGDGGDAGAAPAAASDPALRYSECMRANGVPDFPDPEDGRLMLRAGPGGIDPNAPGFAEAQEACKELAPSGPAAGGAQADAMEARVLEYARCMRENGVPEFPDPKVDGGRVQMRLPQGVQEDSPAFQRAQSECQELLGAAP